jgi:hypothetical protein
MQLERKLQFPVLEWCNIRVNIYFT